MTFEVVRERIAENRSIILQRDELRKAAVLVPIVKEEGELGFLFTKRTEDLEHHKGQVSFPGGAMESGEEPEETALREAQEEIGLLPDRVELIGRVDELWTPSGYCIVPVIGLIANPNLLYPNPNEVSRIFTAPLAFFSHSANVQLKTVHVNGFTRDVYFYEFSGESIWGATAFILRDVLSRLRLIHEKSGDEH